MGKGNKQRRDPVNRQKKDFLKAGGGKQVKEKTWDEKSLEHVRSPGYVEHVPECPNCVHESGWCLLLRAGFAKQNPPFIFS